jgi:hypothetical protein
VFGSAVRPPMPAERAVYKLARHGHCSHPRVLMLTRVRRHLQRLLAGGLGFRLVEIDLELHPDLVA